MKKSISLIILVAFSLLSFNAFAAPPADKPVKDKPVKEKPVKDTPAGKPETAGQGTINAKAHANENALGKIGVGNGKGQGLVHGIGTGNKK